MSPHNDTARVFEMPTFETLPPDEATAVEFYAAPISKRIERVCWSVCVALLLALPFAPYFWHVFVGT